MKRRSFFGSFLGLFIPASLPAQHNARHSLDPFVDWLKTALANEVDDDDARALMARPNPFQTFSALLRQVEKRLYWHGRVYLLIEPDPDRFGVPFAMRVLAPERLERRAAGDWLYWLGTLPIVYPQHSVKCYIRPNQ